MQQTTVASSFDATAHISLFVDSGTRPILDQALRYSETSTKGTTGPGRRPLAYLLYYVSTISPACAQIFISHYAPPIGCSVTHRAATSLAAGGRCGVSDSVVDGGIFPLFRFCRYSSDYTTQPNTRNVLDCDQSNYSSRIFSYTFTLESNTK